MPAQCSPEVFEFARVQSRAVVAAQGRLINRSTTNDNGSTQTTNVDGNGQAVPSSSGTAGRASGLATNSNVFDGYS